MLLGKARVPHGVAGVHQGIRHIRLPDVKGWHQRSGPRRIPSRSTSGTPTPPPGRAWRTIRRQPWAGGSTARQADQSTGGSYGKVVMRGPVGAAKAPVVTATGGTGTGEVHPAAAAPAVGECFWIRRHCVKVQPRGSSISFPVCTWWPGTPVVPRAPAVVKRTVLRRGERSASYY